MSRNGWTTRTLGDLLDAGDATLQTGPFGSQLHSYDYRSNGTPVIPTEAIGTRRLKAEGIPRISTDKANELSRHRLQPGDILFARRGAQATGNSAIVEPQHDGWLCGTGAILLRLKTKSVDPVFLSFYLAGTDARTWLRTHAVGAVMPNLNESVLRRLPIPIPPPAEQRRIAEILGTLDDKIELNRRMNETLEGICRAIFKSWFIDFDPIHAKSTLRRQHPKLTNAELSRHALPHLDAKIAELFPDSFSDSDLGPIPTGWKAGSVDDLVSIDKASIAPARYPAEVFDHYSIPAFDDGRWPKPELGSDIKSNKFVVPESSILISKLNPRIARAWLAPGASSRRRICSTEFLVTLPHRNANSEYVYCLFGSPGFRKQFAGRVTGTSGSHQRVKPADLLAVGCVVPDASCIAGFREAVAALLSAQQHNLAVNRQLTTVRDSLLPNLLSGRLSSLHGGRV